MEEIWKDIKGYEGLYQVSNYGRIKSLEREKYSYNYKAKKEIKMIIKEKILKPYLNKKTYYQISLCKSKNKKKYSIHQLVAQAFIPNPNKYEMLNHKDENGLNNNVNNLEWCDAKYNNNYGNRNQKVANKLSKKVIQYDLDGNIIKIWDSLSQINRHKGFSVSGICQCCNNKIKTIYGFKWEYKKI